MYASLPDRIAKLLAIPTDQRTPTERAELTAHYYTIAPEIDREIARLTRALDAIPLAPMVYAGTHDFKPDGTFAPAKGPRP